MTVTSASARARDFLGRYDHLVLGRSDPGWERGRAEIAERIAASDVPFLTALHDTWNGAPDQRFWTFFQGAFNGLALIDGDDAVTAFLERTTRAPFAWERGVPDVVALLRRKHGTVLGYGQRDAGIIRAIAAHGDDPHRAEILACAVQDRLMRAGTIGGDARVGEFWAQRRVAGDPLAALPLSRLPIEDTALADDNARQDTLGNWFSYDRANFARDAITQDAPTELPVAREISVDERTAARVARFMDVPSVYPHGKVEVRGFALQTALDGAWPSVRGLPLACLADMEAGSLRETPLTSRQAYGRLFQLATQGGAYAVGPSAAHGRLNAWASLRAMLGLPAETPLAETARALDDARVTFFAATAPWFDQVCIDVGFCVVRGDVAVVFAGTDSD